MNSDVNKCSEKPQKEQRRVLTKEQIIQAITARFTIDGAL